MKVKLTLAIIFTLLFLGWGATRGILYIQFDRNVEGYLKRAADANTVQLAAENLDVALKHIEREEWTSGYTNIMYRTPNEDVGFWYKNLRASRDELNQIKPETSLMERTNVLMKLCETLLDHQSKGVSVTTPPGIPIFPFNALFAIWAWVSGILATLFWFFCWADNN